MKDSRRPRPELAVELGHRELERLRDALDLLSPRLGLPEFDATQPGRLDVRVRCQVLLADAAQVAPVTHPLSWMEFHLIGIAQRTIRRQP